MTDEQRLGDFLSLRLCLTTTEDDYPCEAAELQRSDTTCWAAPPACSQQRTANCIHDSNRSRVYGNMPHSISVYSKLLGSTHASALKYNNHNSYITYRLRVESFSAPCDQSHTLLRLSNLNKPTTTISSVSYTHLTLPTICSV